MDEGGVAHGVREQLVAAASSRDPATVEEALRVARPFASELERDYAAATETRDRLRIEGTETARLLLQRVAQGEAATAEIQRTILRFAPVLENAELHSLTRILTVSLKGVRPADEVPRWSSPRRSSSGSPTLGPRQSRDSPPNGKAPPSALSDTMFDQHADVQLGNAIREHAWMGGHSPAESAGSGPETLHTPLQLVKSEREKLQPTVSLLDFEEMEELAGKEAGVQDDNHQRSEDVREDLHWSPPPNSPVLPTPIPLPSPAVPASHSADNDGYNEAVARAQRDVGANNRLVDASLAICEVVVSNCRLPSDTANEVESLMREQRERWAGLAASLLRAEVTGGTDAEDQGRRSSGWGPSELRLLMQHVQAYQKASLRGFLELTYALDEILKNSQVAAAPKVKTLHVLYDDSSYGHPLGLKFVHSSDWARSGSTAGRGMVVKTVVDGGTTSIACPTLNPGAVLVAINEKNVSALSYGQTSALLKVAGQARPLQLMFNQLMSSRSSLSTDSAERPSSVQVLPPAAAPPLTASERETVLMVLRQHSCLPPSELDNVLDSHEGDGYEALCIRVAKVFGLDPRQQRQRQHAIDVDGESIISGPGGRVATDHVVPSPKTNVDEVSRMRDELLSELEAQSALNAEWALKYEELELETSILNAELAELRAENERLRAREAATTSGRGKHDEEAHAVEAVTQAACKALDQRALLLGDSKVSVSVPEAMTGWHEFLNRSRSSWRSDPRVAASVDTLGSALEVTLSLIQQLGASCTDAEEEMLQLRGELASLLDSRRRDPPAIDGNAEAIAQSLEAARTESTTLRAQLAQESLRSPGSSGSPNRRAGAEATEAAATARAQVGTLRASLSQMVAEIDRLHLCARPPPLATPRYGDSNEIGSGTPSQRDLGLAVEEVGGSSSSIRADMAEVVNSLRKLSEVSTAVISLREELAASHRETAALQADMRAVRDGQAAAAAMHSKQEMAEKDAQIAELSAVIEQLESRWDGAEAMRKLAAGSAASETGSVESLLATNDQLTSQLTLMSSQIEQIMMRDSDDVAALAAHLH